MPAVFEHEVPESAAVWRPLLDVLERDDVITANPPGQDPDVGPADIEAMLGASIADRAAPYEQWGSSRDQAYELAEPFADHPAIRVHRLDGVGHWWMLEAPAQAAQILRGFWRSL